MCSRDHREAGSKAEQGDRTRTLILEAARGIFARSGFAGSSMREIAQASGISQALLHHHFGTKERLYDETRAHGMECYRAEIEAEDSEDGDERAFIVHALRARFEFFRKHPDLMRILLWSLLEGKGDETLGTAEMRLRMLRRIDHAREQGRLKSDISLHLLLPMLAGMLGYWFLVREHFSVKPSRLDNRSALDDRYFEDMIRLLMRGIDSENLEAEG